MSLSRIISSVLSLLPLLLFSCSRDNGYIQFPQKGDIYIFEESGIYSPVLVDSVAADSLYIRSSGFVFSGAVPEPEQILDADFDRSFYMIYDRDEIGRLYGEGKIVEVYR